MQSNYLVHELKTIALWGFMEVIKLTWYCRFPSPKKNATTPKKYLGYFFSLQNWRIVSCTQQKEQDNWKIEKTSQTSEIYIPFSTLKIQSGGVRLSLVGFYFFTLNMSLQIKIKKILRNWFLFFVTWNKWSQGRVLFFVNYLFLSIDYTFKCPRKNFFREL